MTYVTTVTYASVNCILSPCIRPWTLCFTFCPIYTSAVRL